MSSIVNQSYNFNVLLDLESFEPNLLALFYSKVTRVTINNPGYLRNYTRRPGYAGTIWMIS